jgi:hypothetical protein
VLGDTREVDLRLLEIRTCVLESDGDDLGAAVEVAVQVLERRALTEYLDHQLVALVPPIVAEERLSDAHVRQSR